ncbi:hypothetical protein FGB62_208g07 [Gracilaria domingensis]|nr:hypothetical protein FGB62_208g07 [Gracilaria domingensis]
MGITTAYCGAEFFRKPGNAVFFARQCWKLCKSQNGSLPPELRLSKGPGLIMGLHSEHPQDQPVLFGTTGTVRSFGTECFGRFDARDRLDLAHVLGSCSTTNGERDEQMFNYLAFQHGTEYCDVDDCCPFLDLQ